ncbi:MAG: hypothetical protein WCD18_14090 [Thermosynechococcaceae cyanobacterium]
MLESLLGTRVTLYLGPAIAIPAPAPIAEALTAIEVTQNADGRDGFQLTFTIGRGGLLGVIDYPLLANPLLRPFSRVVIQVWAGVIPQVIMDGFITNHQVTPSNQPGQSTLTVTGEDMRVIMDMREFSLNYPMPVEARVALILAKYAIYLGAPPIIIPAIVPDVPLPIERIPANAGTDLAYVEELARRTDYVFYIEPTPVPMVNIAYWGPENRLSIPQSALSVNLGAATNVESFNAQYNALSVSTVLGAMQEKQTGVVVPIATFASLRSPLAALPAIFVQQPYVKSTLLRDTGNDPIQTFARAQAATNQSTDVLTASGELDVSRYGNILRARRLVGVRGAGWLLDGFYYVKRVTHKIKKGEYKQSFAIAREGFGAILPVVPP